MKKDKKEDYSINIIDVLKHLANFDFLSHLPAVN